MCGALGAVCGALGAVCGALGVHYMRGKEQVSAVWERARILRVRCRWVWYVMRARVVCAFVCMCQVYVCARMFLGVYARAYICIPIACKVEAIANCL